MSSGLQGLQVCRFVLVSRGTVLANGLIGVPSGSDRHWSEQANVYAYNGRQLGVHARELAGWLQASGSAPEVHHG